MIYLLVLRVLGTQTLVWHDQFDASFVDPAKWTFETGTRGTSKQYFTNNRSQNCRVVGGQLVMQLRKEQFQGCNYTGSKLNTLDKFNITGNFRVDISAQLPEGKGIFPALWMMGSNARTDRWPRCSEIDIMEYIGKVAYTIYTTFHWFDLETSKEKNWGVMYKDETLHSAFHNYSASRVGDTVKVYFDGRELVSFQPPDDSYNCSFVCPLYLLLNIAGGGDWAGPIDDAVLPQRLLIDFVRVYSLT